MVSTASHLTASMYRVISIVLVAERTLFTRPDYEEKGQFEWPR